MADFDSPWKEILDEYFEAFLLFFFPHAHADIDWSRGYEMLDKELQQIMPEAEVGRRWADVLAKVWRRDGNEVWVLVHVEIQSQEEPGFPKRMYVYNYRIHDRYDRPVASFAVLGDERLDWRPSEFRAVLWGCETTFRFPIVKLLDYAKDWAALENNPNPFATVVMAHLKTKETSKDPASRKEWKFRLVRLLFERGFDADRVRKLFRFIDWIMSLPKELNESLWQDVQKVQQEKRMPYITSVERIGMEKGLLEAIEISLEAKFGAPGLELMPEIRRIDELDKLREVLRATHTVKNLEELRRVWAP
jgi:hypothetical protein